MKHAYKIRLATAVFIFILGVLGIYGVFYPMKIFDIQLSALFQRVLTDFSIAALFLLVTVFTITFIFGRFYCSLICPLGILQELITLFKKKNSQQKNLPYKYFLSALIFGVLTGGSAVLIRYIDPYTVFGSAFTLTITGLIVLAAVATLAVIKNRAFCTNFCPVGTILGLISKYSLNKIYLTQDICVSCGKCARVCPSGCINPKDKAVDNETCIKCLKCLDACPQNGVKYGKESKKTQFSLKRRNLIISAAILGVFTGALKSGIELKDKIVQKFSDIILPPGAINSERFLNKCLNCNLCVENCPNKIIKKADKNFNAPHIDYSKNFCKYDCNKCSQVCPSGAIKRITEDEKQNTRIAMAVVNTEKCIKCGLCLTACPKKAIAAEKNNFPIINNKCIGCGACKNICPTGAIEIFAVNEQKML